MNEQFWSGKRVLVTGHTGFKGTWLSLLLNKMNAEVCGYSLPVNKESFYGKANVDISSHNEGDIADLDKLQRVFNAFKPEIVIHLASYSSLAGSMEIPEYILKTNIMGAVNVLETARKSETIQSIVMVTSDKCYKNLEQNKAYNENSVLGASDPYSTSKVCQELLTSCYGETFFSHQINKGIATARASNVVGPGDYNISRLFPYLLNEFSKGRIPTIRNPYAIRPWQYVLDVDYGYLLLAERLYTDHSKYSGAYNFGPDESGFVEVVEATKIVGSCFGINEFTLNDSCMNNSKETKILKLDSTKAIRELNWTYKISFNDMIKETATFIKREQCGEVLSDLCNEWIDNYLEGMKKNV